MPGLVDNNLYLAALVLAGRRCLVVGAGAIGLEKIEGLLACDASVRVVAPDVHLQVGALAEEGSIELHRRKYATGDLDGCWLAIAATSDTSLNTRVFEECESRRMLVNVVDVPHLCTFILPAIARLGPIAIAISTSGASPALAKRMRAEIAEAFGSEYADLALLLNDQRDWAKSSLPTYADRKAFFEDIVNGDPDPIALLRKGDDVGVERLIEEAKARTSSGS